jgi:peroxiredoxin
MSDSGGTGRQAPDFALRTAAGDTVRLSDLRGRHVVLFFIREFT